MKLLATRACNHGRHRSNRRGSKPLFRYQQPGRGGPWVCNPGRFRVTPKVCRFTIIDRQFTGESGRRARWQLVAIMQPPPALNFCGRRRFAAIRSSAIVPRRDDSTNAIGNPSREASNYLDTDQSGKILANGQADARSSCGPQINHS